MFGNNNNNSTNNAVLAPFGGLGGTRTAPGSTFFFPASFFQQPAEAKLAAPTMRANLPSDLGFTSFDTRNKSKQNGHLSTILSGANPGSLLTQRPTLLGI